MIGKRTHCPKGHPYTKENTYLQKGKYPICRKCIRASVAAFRKRNPGKHESYRLNRLKNDPVLAKKRAQMMNRSIKKWVMANPEKHKAHLELRDAVKKGGVEKLPCAVCGSEKSEGHHPDYSRPLEVRWLCRLHHKEEHGRLKLLAIT